MEINWIQLLSTVGAPMLVLSALGVGGWRAGWALAAWVGRELLIPARDKLFVRVDTFCEKVESTMEKQAAAIERLADRLPADRVHGH